MLKSDMKIRIERAGEVFEYASDDLFAAVSLRPSVKGRREVMQFVAGSGSHVDMMELLVCLKSLEKGIVASISKYSKLPEVVVELATDFECAERMKGNVPGFQPPNFAPTTIDLSKMAGFEEFLKKRGDKGQDYPGEQSEEKKKAPEPDKPDDGKPA